MLYRKPSHNAPEKLDRAWANLPGNYPSDTLQAQNSEKTSRRSIKSSFITYTCHRDRLMVTKKLSYNKKRLVVLANLPGRLVRNFYIGSLG